MWCYLSLPTMTMILHIFFGKWLVELDTCRGDASTQTVKNEREESEPKWDCLFSHSSLRTGISVGMAWGEMGLPCSKACIVVWDEHLCSPTPSLVHTTFTGKLAKKTIIERIKKRRKKTMIKFSVQGGRQTNNTNSIIPELLEITKFGVIYSTGCGDTGNISCKPSTEA